MSIVYESADIRPNVATSGGQSDLSGETIAAKVRAAEQRYEGRLKELGISPFGDCINDDDPRSQGFEEAWRSHQEELREILSLLPSSPELPPGWEGESPDVPLSNRDDLTAFVANELRRVQEWGRHREFGHVFVELAAQALLNAHRWLLHSGLLKRSFPARPATTDAAEQGLIDLLVWLKSSVDDGVGETALGERAQQTLAPDSTYEHSHSQLPDNAVEEAVLPTGLEPKKTAEPQGIAWQNAAERLERLRQQGEPYTSRAKLAEQIGCSSSTIQRAFSNVPELRSWEQTKARKTAPTATGLSDSLVASLAQTRESVPSSLPPLDEADVILKRLIAQAPEASREELRRTLDLMKPEERLQMAATYQDADDLDDRIPHRRA